MNECFLYQYGLKISEAAFSRYVRARVHSNVATTNIEDFSRNAVV